jgi:hypothetical protein
MPYENELASKVSHSDIVENPDVREFLSESAYVREPSNEEIERLRKLFQHDLEGYCLKISNRGR